jgi:hypothetical protein
MKKKSRAVIALKERVRELEVEVRKREVAQVHLKTRSSEHRRLDKELTSLRQMLRVNTVMLGNLLH